MDNTQENLLNENGMVFVFGEEEAITVGSAYAKKYQVELIYMDVTSIPGQDTWMLKVCN